MRANRVKSISNFSSDAGCPNPEIMERFIRDFSVIPSGKDLERLISRIDCVGKWLSQIRNVQIHARVICQEPAQYPDRSLLSQESVLAITESLAKITWFYVESSRRFLNQGKI